MPDSLLGRAKSICKGRMLLLYVGGLFTFRYARANQTANYLHMYTMLCVCVPVLRTRALQLLCAFMHVRFN